MSVVLSIGSRTGLPTAGTASVPVRAEAGQLGGATVPPVSPLGPLFPVMTAFLPVLLTRAWEETRDCPVRSTRLTQGPDSPREMGSRSPSPFSVPLSTDRGLGLHLVTLLQEIPLFASLAPPQTRVLTPLAGPLNAHLSGPGHFPAENLSVAPRGSVQGSCWRVARFTSPLPSGLWPSLLRYLEPTPLCPLPALGQLAPIGPPSGPGAGFARRNSSPVSRLGS